MVRSFFRHLFYRTSSRRAVKLPLPCDIFVNISLKSLLIPGEGRKKLLDLIATLCICAHFKHRSPQTTFIMFSRRTKDFSPIPSRADPHLHFEIPSHEPISPYLPYIFPEFKFHREIGTSLNVYTPKIFLTSLSLIAYLRYSHDPPSPEVEHSLRSMRVTEAARNSTAVSISPIPGDIFESVQ